MTTSLTSSPGKSPPKRPLIVTSLVVVVLTISVLNLIRFIQAIRLWEFLFRKLEFQIIRSVVLLFQGKKIRRFQLQGMTQPLFLGKGSDSYFMNIRVRSEITGYFRERRN